jgi:hypothetical protein
MKHILAYVDGTQNDISLLDYASRIALRFDAHIDVLHVRFDSRATTGNKARSGIADRLLAEPVEKNANETAARPAPLRGMADTVQTAGARCRHCCASSIHPMAGNSRL